MYLTCIIAYMYLLATSHVTRGKNKIKAVIKCYEIVIIVHINI